MVDYEKIGFKSGLEVHQQLDGNKLFCKCPCLVNDENKPDVFFKRKLRASAGELGKVDVAAKYEMGKDKEFRYGACSTSSCLVEYDDEPPNELNMDALKTALQAALLMKCRINDEIIFMRKTVVDGSNVCGFQRTALIATDGFIETSKGKVKVDTVCLEEESAKKIKEDEKSVSYRLDRLGVPLIETATAPDLKDAEHVKETASIIGMILRSTEKVKRGIGSIRQDINISVKGHPRVEVKGFQDLRNMVKVIEYEVNRQENEIKNNKKIEGHVRKVNEDGTTSFLRPMPGSSRMYPETDVPAVVINKEFLEGIEIPELITEKVLRLEKEYNLSSELAREVIGKDEFYLLVDKFKKLKAEFIARALVEIPKDIKSRFKLECNFVLNDYYEIFEKLSNNEISKEAVNEILLEKAKGNKIDYSKYTPLDGGKLRKEIKDMVEKNKGMGIGGLMGIIMKEKKGKIDGKKVMEILKEFVK